MEDIRLICIGCPRGCQIQVKKEGSEILEVTGNSCKHGDAYAKKEVTAPTRVVTSTVRIKGTHHMLPVKTKQDIPKDKIFDCIAELRTVEVQVPIQIGDIILADVAGTGISVVAAKNIF